MPDQDPIPEEHRTWTASTYADLINATTWQIASSALAVGLSTTDAILVSSIASILNSIPCSKY